MNSILNYGFVSPYIRFQFESGNFIDTIPPRYFMSFNQVRTVKQACSFTLNIMYAPGNFSEDTASLIHQLLLSNANTRVIYEYGYKTPGGGIKTQGQTYVGIFTKYTETINEGWLTYCITGISSAVSISTPEANISEYIAKLQNEGGTAQPNRVMHNLISGDGDPRIKEFFKGFGLHIEDRDKPIPVESYLTLPQTNASIHDIFVGKSNTDDTRQPNGIANLGVIEFTPQQALSAGYLSQTDYRNYQYYQILSGHGASSSITQEMSIAAQTYKNVAEMKFIAFFDNILGFGGTKGTFNYCPESGRDTNNIFTYNYGNNFLDSDVLSFSCTADWTSALVSYPAIASTRSAIDCAGNNVGSNYITNLVPNFNKTVFNTPSGFDTSAFLTESVLSKAFNFPISATMTVIGQTECNQLMDRVKVNVYVNGLQHIGLTGTYVIMSIEDDLSDSGFTTTFGLTKQVESSTSSMPGVYQAGSDSTTESLKQDFSTAS